MIVKANYKDKDHDYFRDKTTAEKIADQVKRHYGDIFECDDELAEERIKKGLVKKASKKEEKEYYDSIDTIDEDDLKHTDDNSKEGNTEDNEKNDSNESDLSKNGDESTEIKSFLEDCTREELIDIAFKEDICIDEQMSEEQLIETISKVRAERKEQSNVGENNEE